MCRKFFVQKRGSAMKISSNVLYNAIFVILYYCNSLACCDEKQLPRPLGCPPKLTVIFVVDSLSESYLLAHQCAFRGGFKFLLENGVVYTNAYWPHGLPSTGPGHTALNTGTFGKDNGIVTNAWHNDDNKRIECDDDSDPASAVIGPKKPYSYGKSPHNIMTEGLSDTFMLRSKPGARTKAFSIGIKPRATIGTANKLGKAIWFDDKAGTMTSSLYYYKTLPQWLIKFNQDHGFDKLKSYTWNTFHARNSEFYCFDGIEDHRYAGLKSGLVGRTIVMDKNEEHPYETIIETPKANQFILDCAKACILENKPKCHDGKMLVYVCLSPLDKIGHLYGPNSIETIDLLYHLDDQLKYFIRFVNKQMKRSDILFVLTADHGMAPIPERIDVAGYPAYRINVKELAVMIQEALNTEMGFSVKVSIKPPNVYFSKELSELAPDKQEKVLDLAKRVVKEQKGIKNAWKYKELDGACQDMNSIEYWFKCQRYEGRSGKIIIQSEPYSELSKYEGGTSHEAPYECNTHVPLIIYRHQFYEKRIVHSKVWMLQVANSIAHILNIPKPAASTFEILPGLLPMEQELI